MRGHDEGERNMCMLLPGNPLFMATHRLVVERIVLPASTCSAHRYAGDPRLIAPKGHSLRASPRLRWGTHSQKDFRRVSLRGRVHPAAHGSGAAFLEVGRDGGLRNPGAGRGIESEVACLPLNPFVSYRL